MYKIFNSNINAYRRFSDKNDQVNFCRALSDRIKYLIICSVTLHVKVSTLLLNRKMRIEKCTLEKRNRSG